MSELFLHSFNTLSHGLIGYIIPFLFVLTIVVFFHELGHFLVARWAGVKGFTFSRKPSTTARVDKVEASSAAAAAGFQIGDIVTAINGKVIGSFTDMQRIVGIHPGEQLTFNVKRGEATVVLRGTPELREVKDA